MEIFLWFVAFISVIGLVVGVLMVVYYKMRSAAPKKNALKEGDVGFERENRLFQLYQNIEDMVDGFDSYVEETRAALEMERVEFLREKEEITRLHTQVIALLGQFRQEAADATEAVRAAKAAPLELSAGKPEEPSDDAVIIEIAEAAPPSPRDGQKAVPKKAAPQKAGQTPAPARPKPPVPVAEPTGARAISIWGLYSEGKTGDEIARDLGIALGEVNLTLKLLTGGKA